VADRGRPTKLTPEIRVLAKAYLDGGYIDADQVIPSVAGLAVVLGLSRPTLYDWGKNDEDFSYTLEQLKTFQECTLLNNGLNNKFNSTITKLVLTNHGYSEKPAPEEDENDAKPVGINYTINAPQAEIKVTNAKS